MSRITPQAGENSDSIRNYAVEAINAVFALHKPNPTIEDGPRGSSPLKSSRDPATIHIFLLSMFFSLNLIFRVVVLGITDDNYYTKYEYGSIATVLVLTAMSWGAFWIKSYPPRHVLSYWVEDILAISICIILGVLLVVRQSMGSCNTPRSLMQDYCNHLYDEHYLPQTPLLLLAIFPLHLQAIFPTLKPTTVILCTILAMGFLIGTLIGSGARNSILAVVQATIINIWACWGRSNVTTSREIWTGVSSSNVEILQHDTKEDRASTHFEWRALLATLGTDMKKVRGKDHT